mmetsp:Transcript_12796/g.19373  ORF Transcript_12796/g.19373 Transcript_12796/m.19373 type:complete len:580 (+) Transcript_12796:66-1805(+)
MSIRDDSSMCEQLAEVPLSPVPHDQDNDNDGGGSGRGIIGMDSSASNEVNSSLQPRPKSSRETTAAIYQILKVYEHRRKKTFTTQLESTLLYWRSLKLYLKQIIDEVAITERTIRGRNEADAAYAKHIAACASSCFLGENKIDANLFCAEDAGYSDGGRTIKEDASQSQLSKVTTLNEEGYVVEETISDDKSSRESTDCLLGAFGKSNSMLGAKVNENVRRVNEEILSELSELLTELRNCAKRTHLLGTKIIAELKIGEATAEESWSAYSKAVEPSNAARCIWLVETRYRVAVAFFSICWAKCSNEFSKLFKHVKEVETMRRRRRHELMVRYFHIQEMHWLSLSATSKVTMKYLAENPVTDIESVGKHVTELIRQEAKKIQNQSVKTTDSETETEISSPDEGSSKDSEIELASPLLSELLNNAKVLEKRNQGFLTTFGKTLAFATADNYLHFFDVGSDIVNKPQSTISDVFNTLLPAVDTPTFESIDVGNSNGGHCSSRSWHGLVEPTASLFLPNCTLVISHDTTTKSTVAEITETVENAGAVKLFSKHRKRLFYLRAENSDQLTKWISVLNLPNVVPS